MKIDALEIAEYVTEQMQVTFNKKFDVYEDNIIDKVLLILSDEYEIDYSCNKDICKILEKLKSMKLYKKLKTARATLCDITEDEASLIKQLIALYCMLSYNDICNNIYETILRKKLKEIFED